MTPFSAFWSPNQEEVYRHFKRIGKVVLCLDSTGSIVNSPNPTEKCIFLYSICAKPESFRSFNLAYFVSSRHSTTYISFFLDIFRQSFSIPSPELHIDESAALISASVHSFTSCGTLNNYLKRCYLGLENQREATECYIRLDVAHFVKNLHNSKELAKLDKRARDFVIRIFGFLISVTDFNAVKNIVKDLLITVLSIFDSKSSDSQLETFKSNLIKIIGTHELPYELNDVESYEVDINQLDDDDFCDDWTDDILHSVEILNLNEDGRDNLFYAPTILRF